MAATTDTVYHVPVMLAESVDGLNIQPGGTYADATFGGGGHSAEILRRLRDGGRLFAFDQDADAIERGKSMNNTQFTLVHSNFRYLRGWMRYYGMEQLDGILVDLGVSSHHFDDACRGFTFRQDAPLDMRMNRSGSLTAADVLNSYDATSLARVLKVYGEVAYSAQLSAAIVRRREKEPFATTAQLIALVDGFARRDRQKKELAKVFQALRIEVNGELEALIELLSAAKLLLRAGGRLSIITYHSLEDRIVKNFMRDGNIEGKPQADFFGRRFRPFRLVGGKVMTPDEEEIERNPRSRSAKLRIAERTTDM